MWGFFSAIFNKIASVAAAVLVAVGLVSTPLPPVSEAPVAATSSQEAVQGVALDQPKKAEKPAVSTAAKTEKSEADDLETKKLEEKLAQTAQLLEALKKASPSPTPTPAPTPAPQYFTTPNGVTLDKFGNVVSSSGGGSVQPAPPPISTPPGTFRLPNGALVDANGNIIQPAPSAANNPPLPPPPASGNYASGSTIQLPRSVSTAIGFNPDVSCENLGFS